MIAVDELVAGEGSVDGQVQDVNDVVRRIDVGDNGVRSVGLIVDSPGITLTCGDVGVINGARIVDLSQGKGHESSDQ